MSHYAGHIWLSSRRLTLALLLLITICGVNGDCGCGMRCQKYVNDNHCARCCTATVRRSVSYSDYPEQQQKQQLQTQSTTDDDGQWPAASQKDGIDHLNQSPFVLRSAASKLASKPSRVHSFDHSALSQFFVMRNSNKNNNNQQLRRSRRTIMADIVKKLVDNTKNSELRRTRNIFVVPESSRTRAQRGLSSRSTQQLLQIVPVLR
uniref:Uncharacterized protein n=1 Tax=Ditylenchus dipsaci TaxID=166011 RepID=A0A915DD76_9BILA